MIGRGPRPGASLGRRWRRAGLGLVLAASGLLASGVMVAPAALAQASDQQTGPEARPEARPEAGPDSRPDASQDADIRDAGAALHALFDEAWAARLARDPLFATRVGARRYNDRLPDVSPEAHARAAAQARRLRDRLAAIDRAALSPADRINADLFAYVLDRRLSEQRFKTWRMPFLSDSGFHTRLSFVVEATPFETVADYEAYLDRLAAMPRYLDQHRANMAQGLADGFTQPRAILDQVAPSFAALAVTRAEDSAFFAPFEAMPEAIAAADAARLRDRGRRLLTETVLPAFATLHRFFTETYMPEARTSLGASDQPEGDAYYQAQIRHYTTLDLDARAIHQMGLDEVARIRARMEAIIDEVGFEGGFQAFVDRLRSDPRFYAETPEALLKQAAWIAKRIDEKLPAFFATMPRTPYGVRAVPAAIAPNYTSGRYWPPIPGQRGGLFMVNTHNLAQRPLYNLPALALHEGVPGHHFQIALQLERDDLPAFRRYIGLSAFSEGWGLYSERLGEEMGLYTTPYERFGRLTYEMWRAGRLVVDTGIHAMGWSRERAVRFFRENSALAEHNIRTEVDRYISWPGQALAYKLGEMRIVALRDKAEAALGAAFDRRAFHDAVLAEGAVTLPMLDRQIAAHIDAHKP